jgi:hypothetical protein
VVPAHSPARASPLAVTAFEPGERLLLNLEVDGRGLQAALRVGVETALARDVALTCQELSLHDGHCASLALAAEVEARRLLDATLAALPGMS